MIRKALNLAVVALALSLVPALAGADPVTLRLSYITSDRADPYQCYVKPFVEAVNADGAGIVQIKVYFSGAISPDMTKQARLVLDGAADLAFVVPGTTPQKFPDISVLELPGLFRNEREASLVFARLTAVEALEGYRKFFVVGAFLPSGETIHSRKPIASLADLKGQKIRADNPIVGQYVTQAGRSAVSAADQSDHDGSQSGHARWRDGRARRSDGIRPRTRRRSSLFVIAGRRTPLFGDEP